MSEDLKPAAVHDANVFLPGSLGPVRREIVLAYEHDRVVDQLRAELAALKAGQGEAVVDVCPHGVRLPHECDDCIEGRDVPYGWVEPTGGVFVDNFTKMCMRDRDAAAYSLPLYTAPPATGVNVPRELLESATKFIDQNTHYQFGEPITSYSAEGARIADELRALLARQESKQ